MTNSEEYKNCSKCESDKPLSEFKTDKRYKDGYNGWCRRCHQDYLNHYRKTNGRKNYLRDKRKRHIRSYGITPEQYEQLLIEQNFSCAICEEVGYSQEEWDRFISGEEKTELDRKKLFIDHCHNGNGVRGLLCSECNNGIGKLKDDPELLQRGIYYLKRKGLITV